MDEETAQDLFFKRYENSPLLLLEEWFGINTTPFPDDLTPEGYKGDMPLWSKQVEIIEAVIKYKKVAVKSAHACGKALWNESIVPTPTGMKRFGSLSVGDLVFGDNGKPTEIVGRYPQGSRKLVDVVFDDGSSVTCDLDHLWLTTTRDERKMRAEGKARTTREILSTLNFDNGALCSNHSIPVQGAAQFDEQPLPVDPYAMGVWLANGTFGKPLVTISEKEIFRRLKITAGVSLIKRNQKNTYYLRTKNNELENMGVMNAYVFERRIPEAFKYNSIANRLAILQGLFDCNGAVNKRGHCTYSTTSKFMADEICWLVRSFGGKAHEPRKKETNYTYLGKKLDGKPIYVVAVYMPVEYCPFTVKWKKDRLSIPKNDSRWMHRFIVDVKDMGDGEATCIKVASENSLFLANNFTVTHNTYTAALVALILFYTRRALGITTAPTFRQVRRLLWGEINKQHSRMENRSKRLDLPSLGGKLNKTSLEMTGKWYMEGFSTDKPDSFQGAHEENIFLIVDEAAGVEREIFDAAEGILTSENSYVLLIGNPTDPTGSFFEACQPGSGFHVITMSAFDTPNIRHDRIIYNQLVSPDWVRDKLRKWGADSPMYQARVLGEFPQEGDNVLIPLKYTTAALRKYQQMEDDDFDLSSYKIKCMSADIARFGTDSTIVGARFDAPLDDAQIAELEGKTRDVDGIEKTNKIFEIIDEAGKTSIPDSYRIIKQHNDDIKHLSKEPIPVCIDDIGLGGGVTDLLIEDNYEVVPINVSVPASDFSSIEDDEVFANLRAKLYWMMRDDYVNGRIAISDEELASQISKIFYLFTPTRKIQIEAKKDYKDRVGVSPDKADCQMLSYGEYAQPSVQKL